MSFALSFPPYNSGHRVELGLQVQRLHLEAGILPEHAHERHLLVLHQLPRPVLLPPASPGTPPLRYASGDLCLSPQGEHLAPGGWHAPSTNIYVSIAPAYLRQLAGTDAPRLTLREQNHFTDPLLQHLSQQLAAGTMNPRYAQAMAEALGQHLLAHYAAGLPPAPRPRQHLPAPVLARLDAYLEAHTHTGVTLAELAELAHLSVFHFARLFKQTTGLAPHQYVLAGKLARARHLLRHSQQPVAAIGEAAGFSSGKVFAVAFRRAVGCTPQQYRRAT